MLAPISGSVTMRQSCTTASVTPSGAWSHVGEWPRTVRMHPVIASTPAALALLSRKLAALVPTKAESCSPTLCSPAVCCCPPVRPAICAFTVSTKNPPRMCLAAPVRTRNTHANAPSSSMACSHDDPTRPLSILSIIVTLPSAPPTAPRMRRLRFASALCAKHDQSLSTVSDSYLLCAHSAMHTSVNIASSKN